MNYNFKMDVLVVAAGSSTRFGGRVSKPFVDVEGRMLINYSLTVFEQCDFIDRIFIAVSPGIIEVIDEYREKILDNISKFAGFIAGGETRSHTVFNSLRYLKSNGEPQVIAIHDAARPLITAGIMKKLLNSIQNGNGCAPAIDITDTVKQVDESGLVKQHLKRDSLKAIQTPQCFYFDKLYAAYEEFSSSLSSFTDDTELYSAAGHRVELVEGDVDLFKITFEDDILQLRNILQKRSGQKKWILE